MHLFFLSVCIITQKIEWYSDDFIKNIYISFKTYEIFAVMLTPSSAFL